MHNCSSRFERENLLFLSNRDQVSMVVVLVVLQLPCMLDKMEDSLHAWLEALRWQLELYMAHHLHTPLDWSDDMANRHFVGMHLNCLVE